MLWPARPFHGKCGRLLKVWWCVGVLRIYMHYLYANWIMDTKLTLIIVELAKIIESATTSDELVQNISNVLSTKGIPPIKSSLSDWKIENGKLFYQERCYIPDHNGIWKLIVQEIHDSPMTGHPGRDTTLEMVQHHYWWPRLHHFVYKYVAGCATCQQNKVNTHATQLPTQPIKSTAMKPFQWYLKISSQGYLKQRKVMTT